MNSNEAKATVLVISLDTYDYPIVAQPYIDLQLVTLVATNEEGVIISESMISAASNPTLHLDKPETRDVPGAILAFIEGNFEGGQVTMLVGAELWVVNDYVNRMAQLLKPALQDAEVVDVTHLAGSLPAKSLVRTDVTRGRAGYGPTAYDALSAFLFFDSRINLKRGIRLIR